MLELRIRIDSYTPELEKDLARLDELWNQGLARFGGPYLAGRSFTAADAFFAPVAFRVQTYGLIMAHDSILYTKHLLELPSMQDWYAAALLETWRHDAYDEITRNAGTLLNDYRAIGANCT
jgi:glutathione S-transferase